MEKDALERLPLRERQVREESLWRQWSITEDPQTKQQAIDGFFDSFQPRLGAWKRRLGASTLPGAVIDAELASRTLDAFEKYDPTKGAKLNTWIDSNLQGVYRWVLDAQNLGRIPSHRQALIGTYNRVKEELTYRLGRPPSAAEIADEAPMDLTTVEKLERELRKDIQLTSELAAAFVDERADPELERIIDLVYYELTPEEQVVYEHWLGKHGRAKMSGNEIAAMLGKSASAISEIKSRIRAKMEHYATAAERERLTR